MQGECLLGTFFGSFECYFVFDASTDVTYESMEVHNVQFRFQRNAAECQISIFSQDATHIWSTHPSKTSSTPLLTRSPTSFHPTCNNHQLIVRYLFSTSSGIASSSTVSSSPKKASKSFDIRSSKPLLFPNSNFVNVSSDSKRSRTRSSRSC